MIAADLEIASRGVNRERSLFRHVAQIIRHLLDGPSCGPGPMGKIVAEIMEGDIVPQIPFRLVALPAERAEPMMNAGLRESCGLSGPKRM